MSRSTWLIAISGILGISVILGVLTQCGSMQSGDPAAVTPLPTKAVIRENTVGIVQVTPTQVITTARLSPTLQPITFTATIRPTSTQVSALPSGIPILPPGGPGAATNLQSVPICNLDFSSQGMATLTWTRSKNRGIEQRVALTTYVRGFETGAYVVVGPLPPDQQEVVWEQTNPGITHFWLVLTLHTEGWIPSEVSSFEGAVCLSDSGETTSVP
jgi:hypothetical protein